MKTWAKDSDLALWGSVKDGQHVAHIGSKEGWEMKFYWHISLGDFCLLLCGFLSSEDRVACNLYKYNLVPVFQESLENSSQELSRLLLSLARSSLQIM